MAWNPMILMKMKKRLEIFQQQHPKFPLFLKAVGENAIAPGTVLEVKATTADGKEYVSNIRLTPEDVETVNMIRNGGKENE